jgi:hypothetical protein
MNTLLKSALLSVLDHAITAEPALAGEVISYLDTKGVPELAQYVESNVPEWLKSLEARLTAATAAKAAPAQDVTVKVLPPPEDAPAAAPAPAPMVGTNVVVH